MTFDHTFCEGVQGHDIISQKLSSIKREDHYVLLEFETQSIFLCVSGSFQCNIEETHGFHHRFNKVPYQYKLANGSIIGDELDDIHVKSSNEILIEFRNHVITAMPEYAYQVTKKAHNEIFK